MPQRGQTQIIPQLDVALSERRGIREADRRGAQRSQCNDSERLHGNLPGARFLPGRLGQEETHNEAVCIFDEYGPVRMIRTEDWKYVYRHAHGPDELFDLVTDPDERVNLANAGDYQDKRLELKGRMDEWFARYVIPERDGLKETSEMWR